MQSILAISISLFSLLSPVLGTPGNVFVCTGSNWSNTCEVLTLGIDGACTRLPSTYDGHIGSAGPDPGAICRLFTNGDCTGHGVAILYNPGDSNLYNSVNGIDAGHQAHYIQCRSCTACT
ncbi:hypothetical protein N0V85_000931 [Neurospora sp. IMI 360204]|nr:hypothetical protein N0V85_000931 [Neurospora sp. IMI 360204]